MFVSIFFIGNLRGKGDVRQRYGHPKYVCYHPSPEFGHFGPITKTALFFNYFLKNIILKIVSKCPHQNSRVGYQNPKPDQSQMGPKIDPPRNMGVKGPVQGGCSD